MLEIEQALSLVLQHVERTPRQCIPTADAVGSVLAENVASDIDSPPHDKALMDGYAVRTDDLSTGVAEFNVLEEVTAGSVPTQPIRSGFATRIMTGAPIPLGANAVVILEHSDILHASPLRVRLHEPHAQAGLNILRQGQSLRRGEIVLHEGTEIRPVEVGLLAEVGRTEVAVHVRPRVAVLSTGNELVPASRLPDRGKIRNSNGPMLIALAAHAGASPVDLGIGFDQEDDLRARILDGLREDVLVLSGGVSMGTADLVPKVLNDLGVKQVFHKVRMKPGKPIWFGFSGLNERKTLVFGLPGNPVSSLVGFELFVRPAISQLKGRRVNQWPLRTVRLAHAHQQRGDRAVFRPAFTRQQGSELVVELLEWHGSADLRTLADADCLAYFPAGEHDFSAGETINTYPL
jgi:molybdopterin molybdotransferase